MAIDRKKLLALWDLEGIPMCDDGMERAAEFLETAGRLVESRNLEQIADLRETLLTTLSVMAGHREACPKCNEE